MKIISIIIIVAIVALAMVVGFYLFSINNNEPVAVNSENPVIDVTDLDGDNIADVKPDFDRTDNISADLKKIPNDTMLSNYFVKINDLIKGF